MSASTKGLTGKYLNELWGIKAKHSLYSVDGKWYHQLSDFPGALFDINGYIIFATEQEYQNCPFIQIKKHIHAPEGISSIPGYIRISEKDQLVAFSLRIMETSKPGSTYAHQSQSDELLVSQANPQDPDLSEETIEAKRSLIEIRRIIRDTKIAHLVKVIHNYKCQICGETIRLSGEELYAESHHLKPLGGDHCGPDIIENIICVCPNHHVQLDYGAIKIDKTKLKQVKGHNVGDTYITYHNNLVFESGTSKLVKYSD